MDATKSIEENIKLLQQQLEKRSGQPKSIYDHLYTHDPNYHNSGYYNKHHEPTIVHHIHGSLHNAHAGYGPDCCPLVVDPLTLGALFVLLGVGTQVLNMAITQSIGRRKKRSDYQFDVLVDLFHHGRISQILYILNNQHS